MSELVLCWSGPYDMSLETPKFFEGKSGLFTITHDTKIIYIGMAGRRNYVFSESRREGKMAKLLMEHGVLSGTSTRARLAVLELRNLVKQRQTDLFMKVYSIFGSGKFSKAVRRLLATEVKNYDDFVKKHGSVVSIEPEPSQIWLDIDLIGWFFNEMGFLVNEKLVDEKLVCKLLGYWVIILWEKVKPLIYGWREQYNMPKSFEWFEYLYNEMKKIEKRTKTRASRCE